MIYAKDMQKTALFYTKYFNFQSNKEIIDGLIELNSESGNIQILIHQAAKSLKTGQANIKLVFQFSNTKDPDGNSISISSRRYR